MPGPCSVWVSILLLREGTAEPLVGLRAGRVPRGELQPLAETPIPGTGQGVSLPERRLQNADTLLSEVKESECAPYAFAVTSEPKSGISARSQFAPRRFLVHALVSRCCRRHGKPTHVAPGGRPGSHACV